MRLELPFFPSFLRRGGAKRGGVVRNLFRAHSARYKHHLYLDFPQIIFLAHFHATVPQDSVSGGGVKIQVGQHVKIEIR